MYTLDWSFNEKELLMWGPYLDYLNKCVIKIIGKK
jgi:hypothetical protein